MLSEILVILGLNEMRTSQIIYSFTFNLVIVGEFSEESQAINMERQSGTPAIGPGVNFMKQLWSKILDKN
jgi:hypothetical protein